MPEAPARDDRRSSGAGVSWGPLETPASSKEQRRLGVRRVPAAARIRPREQRATHAAEAPETSPSVKERRSRPALPHSPKRTSVTAAGRPHPGRKRYETASTLVVKARGQAHHRGCGLTSSSRRTRPIALSGSASSGSAPASGGAQRAADPPQLDLDDRRQRPRPREHQGRAGRLTASAPSNPLRSRRLRPPRPVPDPPAQPHRPRADCGSRRGSQHRLRARWCRGARSSPGRRSCGRRRQCRRAGLRATAPMRSRSVMMTASRTSCTTRTAPGCAGTSVVRFHFSTGRPRRSAIRSTCDGEPRPWRHSTPPGARRDPWGGLSTLARTGARGAPHPTPPGSGGGPRPRRRGVPTRPAGRPTGSRARWRRPRRRRQRPARSTRRR